MHSVALRSLKLGARLHRIGAGDIVKLQNSAYKDWAPVTDLPTLLEEADVVLAA